MAWRSNAARAAGRWLFTCACASSCWLLSPARAEARRFYRARFETEALELELPGEIELDAQVGAIYGDSQDQSRLLVPDVEIDVGVCAWLEIDLDGALSLTKLETEHEKLVGDPLWLTARVDALNWKDDDSDASFGLGLQVGPRLPSVATPTGVGFAALLLVGGGTRALHVAANVGTLLDYHQERAVLYGVDAEYELNERWSVLGNFAAAYYFGGDPQQLLLDAGVSYKANKRLAFSLLAIAGPFVHGDRAGGLLSVSYSFQAWGRAQGDASTQAPQPN
jgi:hypothetical protein